MAPFKREELEFPYEPSSHKDMRWEAPNEQAPLLETSVRLFQRETSELPEFAALMTENSRAFVIDQLVTLTEYAQSLIRQINQHNR
jgi:hypothetical protein